MKTLKQIISYFFVIVFSIVLYSCSEDAPINTISSPSALASTIDAKYALDWLAVEYAIISDQHDDSPPPPSRMYGYTCVTIYECVAPGIPGSRSLAGQLHEMPQMPAVNITLEYDWATAIAAAIPIIIEGTYDTVYPGGVQLINDKQEEQIADRRKVVSEEVIQRSLQHGTAVANTIVAWADGDNYRETRTLGYTPPPRSQNPANWEPINPGDHANEPYWGTLRPFIIPHPNQFYIPLAFPKSTNAGSEFYNQHMELVNTSQTLTLEQKRIANFWNDKIRTGCPAGHWVSIMDQISRQLNLKLDRVAQMYALMGPNMYDAFVICWWGKYQSNTLRPQSYIRDYIDAEWFPFLITPPFPAYSSGHSTVSGSSAEILTHLFGTVAFTDYTHQSIGYQPRSFASFNDAATEAGFSRLYGGIHIREDIITGLDNGHNIGRYVLEHISLTH